VKPEWVPLQVAAQVASVSVRTVKRWIKRRLPVYQSGPRTKLLVRVRDLETFLKRKPIGPMELEKLVNAVVGEVRG
jgi:hypothetical protein